MALYAAHFPSWKRSWNGSKIDAGTESLKVSFERNTNSSLSYIHTKSPQQSKLTFIYFIFRLKLVLLDIERQLGRVRKPNSNAYALDMDISFYGNVITEYLLNCAPLGKRRVVPHPETLNEAHVIIALADVTPDFVHPETKKTLKTLAKEISGEEDISSLFSIVQETDFPEMTVSLAEASQGKDHNFKITHRGEDLPSISQSMLNGTLLSNGADTSESVFNHKMDVSKLKESKPLATTFQTNGSCYGNSCHGNYFVSSNALCSRSVNQLGDCLSCNGSPLVNVTLPVALVTGAAKRLGACIARKLHAAGYRVIIHYNKSKTEAEDLLTELNR